MDTHDAHADDRPRLTVKFVLKNPIRDDLPWRRQMPGGRPRWGRCDFVFDPDARDYDWLVVYDELPPRGEKLACPRTHTMLVTAEPASIKVYGGAYLRQFGAVLTSHEPWALKHPGAIRNQPGLQWFYGRPTTPNGGPTLGYDQLAHDPPPTKTLMVSTVCSNKRMGHTLHSARYDFVQRLKQAMPRLDVFGHGVRPINDKAEALAAYKYHVAIENHLAPHHFTEKLADPLLAECLPLYFGAPNASDYIPAESYIPIDIRRPDRAIAVIKRAIADGEYEQRLAAIRQAKRRILDEHNLFAVLASHIDRLDTGQRGGRGKLLNRRVFRRRSPIGAVRYLIERYTVQARVRREAGI